MQYKQIFYPTTTPTNQTSQCTTKKYLKILKVVMAQLTHIPVQCSRSALLKSQTAKEKKRSNFSHSLNSACTLVSLSPFFLLAFLSTCYVFTKTERETDIPSHKKSTWFFHLHRLSGALVNKTGYKCATSVILA